MPNFTTEDLLVYIYEEMEPEQSNELASVLASDWALRQKYQVLIEAQGTLNGVKLSSPRIATINKILSYAESKVHLSN